MKNATRYHRLEKLGQGGYAVVYRAWDSLQMRDVALKVMTSQSASDHTARLRFEREAEVLRTLDHPSIPKIFEAGTDAEGLPYLAMQLLRAVDPATLSMQQKVEMAIKLCDCLQYAHQRGVLHRDIKPENIIAGPGGRVWLVDWGLAGPLGDLPRLTLENTFLGTLRYCSPEQLQGQSLRSNDVFSLGATLYELFTGQAAQRGETAHDLISEILVNEAIPADRIARIPAALSDLLVRMLRKDLTRRLDELSEVKAELEKLRTTTPPGGFIGRLQRLAS